MENLNASKPSEHPSNQLSFALSSKRNMHKLFEAFPVSMTMIYPRMDVCGQEVILGARKSTPGNASLGNCDSFLDP